MEIADKYGQLKEQFFLFSLDFLSQNSDFWTRISDAMIFQIEITEMEHRHRPEF